MLSVDAARARLREVAGVLPSAPTPLEDAAGLALAVDLVADRDLPGFDSSAMDGFAVMVADLEGASRERPARLDIVGDVNAGSVYEGEVKPGTAVRIMTGAPIPAGAEAVIEVEKTEVEGDTVVVFSAVEPGRSFRLAASDIPDGGAALPNGVYLGPSQLALLAALGVTRPECYRRPRVAVVVTGDELVDAATDPGPGQVVDVATPSLGAAIAGVGAQPVMGSVVRDRSDAIRDALSHAADASDLVVSTGGVSMGARDLVRPVVEEIGELDFWRVAMRPGKPLAVGRVRGTPFIGLPGNPVTALVGFEVFVLPTIMSMSNRHGWARPVRQAVLTKPLKTPVGLRTFARAVAGEGPTGLVAEPLPGQASYQLGSLARANALLDIPEEIGDLERGATVSAIMVDQPPGPMVGR